MRISKRIFDKIFDKNVDYDINSREGIILMNMIPKVISMFEWDGLPDSIPSDILETYLHCNGIAGVHKVEGKWRVSDGTFSDDIDFYGRGTSYLWTAPGLEGGNIEIAGNSGVSEPLEIGYNLPYGMSIIPYMAYICKLLARADSNLEVSLTNSNLNDIYEVQTESQKKQLEKMLANRKDGEPLITIREMNDLDEFRSRLAADNSTSIKEFIPSSKGDAQYIPMILQAYDDLFARLCREIGIDVANKMKKAQVQEAELNGYRNYSEILLHSMYIHRVDFAERLSSILNTEIKVKVSEAFSEDTSAEIASDEMHEEESEDLSEDESEDNSEDESEDEKGGLIG